MYRYPYGNLAESYYNLCTSLARMLEQYLAMPILTNGCLTVQILQKHEHMLVPSLRKFRSVPPQAFLGQYYSTRDEFVRYEGSKHVSGETEEMLPYFKLLGRVFQTFAKLTFSKTVFEPVSVHCFDAVRVVDAFCAGMKTWKNTLDWEPHICRVQRLLGKGPLTSYLVECANLHPANEFMHRLSSYRFTDLELKSLLPDEYIRAQCPVKRALTNYLLDCYLNIWYQDCIYTTNFIRLCLHENFYIGDWCGDYKGCINYPLDGPELVELIMTSGGYSAHPLCIAKIEKKWRGVLGSVRARTLSLLSTFITTMDLARIVNGYLYDIR